MGPWCSPVNTIACHAIDRRFKSGRARLRYTVAPGRGKIRQTLQRHYDVAKSAFSTTEF